VIGGRKTVGLRTALAEQIRLLRKECGFSQEELAWRSGLHRTYISMVERAKRSVTIDSLQSIALVLGLSASALLARAERSLRRRGGTGK
jgi:transcriptional regulator with XRE-family HTH domain